MLYKIIKFFFISDGSSTFNHHQIPRSNKPAIIIMGFKLGGFIYVLASSNANEDQNEDIDHFISWDRFHKVS